MSTIKSLIIHPADESTDFLKSVYAHLKNATLITGLLNNQQISQALQKSDRPILLGHGIPTGLLSVNKFYDDSLTVVNGQHVKYLRGKEGAIYIWCHANIFVEKHQLNGFYTGMFISEMAEAKYHEVEATEAQIEFSNFLFSETVGKSIHLSPHQLLHEVLKNYGAYRVENPVIDYNVQRLYAR
jgi:hypothetical protein